MSSLFHYKNFEIGCQQAEKNNVDSLSKFYEIIKTNEDLGIKLNSILDFLSGDMDKLATLIQKQSNFEGLLKILAEDAKQLKLNDNEKPWLKPKPFL